MRNARVLCPLLFLMLLSAGPGSRPVRAGDTTGAAALLPITDYADSLGYSWRWERAFRRLTCVRHPVQFRFYEDNAFYYVNGTVDQLPEVPVRKGASLCLTRPVLEEIFSPEGTAAPAVGRPKTVFTHKAGVNIFSAVSEKKKNGTLLMITLADSLPMEVTYFFPNLSFNFYGGKLDTTAIAQTRRIGIIDSVFSRQFKKSAQITALLVREIEEPMIDYVGDTCTIMVSLWTKKTADRKGAGKEAVPAKKKSPPKSKKSQKNSSRPEKSVIVIDPGHGGKDPGCISASGGTKEKDVVLSVAKKLRDNLKKHDNITVYMTRDKDVFIPLADRTRFANEKKAHLFISIHADAIGGSTKRKQSIRGYKIYFLSQAKNEEDKLVAMRENAVIKLEEKPQNYSNLQNVLIEMAGNEYLKESQDLCILLEKTFSRTLNKKIDKLHRGIGQANFWVLNGAFMPSVLIETGFLSNKKEEKVLKDSKFQKEIAASISMAVVEFCKEIETGL